MPNSNHICNNCNTALPISVITKDNRPLGVVNGHFQTRLGDTKGDTFKLKVLNMVFSKGDFPEGETAQTMTYPIAGLENEVKPTLCIPCMIKVLETFLSNEEVALKYNSKYNSYEEFADWLKNVDM